jgi:hypothetical protein
MVREEAQEWRSTVWKRLHPEITIDTPLGGEVQFPISEKTTQNEIETDIYNVVSLL